MVVSRAESTILIGDQKKVEIKETFSGYDIHLFDNFVTVLIGLFV